MQVSIKEREERTLMKAIRIYKRGGPEVLRWEEITVPKPGPSEALLKHEAVGLNFIDIYYREGQYKAQLPFVPGLEAAGNVEAVGPDVSEVRVGDRVAYCMSLGAYAEQAVVPAWKLVVLPSDVDFNTAAALMVQGLTAHYLTHSSYPIQPGEVILAHAAAGGVGLLLVQMAKMLGATVIATVSTEAKAELASRAGADEIILYTEKDFEAEVRRVTAGEGVSVVYDSVGQTTFDKSLNCLRPRGYMVLFGQSSGAVPPLNPQALNAKGSLFLTRPSLAHHIATREELLRRSGEIFKWASGTELQVRIDRTVPLAEASQAQTALETRQTTGKVLLTL